MEYRTFDTCLTGDAEMTQFISLVLGTNPPPQIPGCAKCHWTKVTIQARNNNTGRRHFKDTSQILLDNIMKCCTTTAVIRGLPQAQCLGPDAIS